MAFVPAVKENTKGRVALVGPAGTGKTYTALQMMQAMGVKKTAVIDTERGSARKYSDLFKFDTDETSPNDPRKLLEVIKEAGKAGYDGLIIDSFSAVWSGKGGFLEKVDVMGGNKFANGWKAMTPVFNELIDTILTYPGHVICTMRSKTEYVVEVNAEGKSVPRRVGLKPIQREDAEYEFDLVLQLGQGGDIQVTKQRGMPDLEGKSLARSELPWLYDELKEWLQIG